MHMRSGIVVYLDYPAEVLARRVVADGSAAKRPMLKAFANDERCNQSPQDGCMV